VVFECSEHLSENRGVPGSSPGLAIIWAEIRLVAGFSSCRCDKFESSETTPGKRGVLGSNFGPESRVAIGFLGTRTEDTTPARVLMRVLIDGPGF
jgi:hypothetical protein